MIQRLFPDVTSEMCQPYLKGESRISERVAGVGVVVGVGVGLLTVRALNYISSSVSDISNSVSDISNSGGLPAA